jgi:hypothetical protein
MDPRPPSGNRVYRKPSRAKELYRKERKGDRKGRKEEKPDGFFAIFAGWSLLRSLRLSFLCCPKARKILP